MSRRHARETPGPMRAALLVVAVAAPVLVVASVLVVQALAGQQRETLETSALEEARSVLTVFPDDVDGPTARELARALRRPGQLEVVLIDADGEVSRSSAQLDLADVPGDVRSGEDSPPASAPTVVDGERFLVAGGSTGSAPTSVFLFYSERTLEEDRTRTMLLVTSGSAILLALAAGGGWWRSHRRALSLSRRRSQERAYTAHLAHELRTPVGALVTAASLIDGPSLRQAPETMRQPVEMMQTQSRRLRRIVEDLLELSRLEAGQVDLRLEPVDVAQVVREIVATYGWDDVRVEESGATTARADRQSLARLTLNLVANARRHARQQVRVEVHGADESVVLEVGDDGPGLDPGLAAHLAAGPDRSGRSAARPHHGLGLLISRAHADLLGARVEVETSGTGTTIRVRLEAAHPASAAVDGDA